jgi:hypothetical protein
VAAVDLLSVSALVKQYGCTIVFHANGGAILFGETEFFLKPGADGQDPFQLPLTLKNGLYSFKPSEMNKNLFTTPPSAVSSAFTAQPTEFESTVSVFTVMEDISLIKEQRVQPSQAVQPRVLYPRSMPVQPCVMSSVTPACINYLTPLPILVPDKEPVDHSPLHALEFFVETTSLSLTATQVHHDDFNPALLSRWTRLTYSMKIQYAKLLGTPQDVEVVTPLHTFHPYRKLHGAHSCVARKHVHTRSSIPPSMSILLLRQGELPYPARLTSRLDAPQEPRLHQYFCRQAVLYSLYICCSTRNM